MNKLLIIINAFFISMAFMSHADAISVDGGFETGTISDWQISIKGAQYYNAEGLLQDDVNQLPFSIFEADPVCPGCDIMPSIEFSNHYVPVQGERYLEIPGNSSSEYPFYYEGDTYVANLAGSTISVSTELALDSGDTLSGWIALYTTDYPPYNSDRAFIEVRNSEIDAQPAQVTVQDAWGDDWGSSSVTEPHASPWTYWSWTAPERGLYTLSLSNYMDDQEASNAGFDGIALYHPVPEPASALLLVFSIFGLIGVKKIIPRQRG